MKKSALALVLIAAYALLFWGLFHESWGYMWYQWQQDDYNHCYLIPFVVAYLVWTKREELAMLAQRVIWPAVIPLVLGLGLFWVGELGGEYYTLYLSAWLFMLGICWLHLGWERVKALGFPLFLVLTMFPFPNFITTQISLKLQLVSSWLGVAIIQLFGLPVYREGNIIDLGFTQLQVVDACSGLRYMLPLIVLAIVLAYFFRARWWKKLLLILSAVPIAVALNSGRIALTGLFSKWFSPKVAEGFFHDFSGWILFMVSLVLLLLVMGVLRLLPGRVSDETEYVLPARLRDSFADHPWWRQVGLLRFLAVAGVMSLTWTVADQVDFRREIPLQKPLTGFPLEIDGWQGRPLVMEQRIVDTLDLSDYTMITYRQPSGHSVDFYLAYYESQRKGESVHSPETCLPGGGWIFSESGTVTFHVPALAGGEMTVNRAFIHSGSLRELVYFWFPQRGRILQNIWQLKAYTFWDALTRQRTDGALVRVITPIGQMEDLADADERLQQFVRELVPELQKFLPGA